MKFNKKLNDELVPEWRANYLDYKSGKRLLKSLQQVIDDNSYHSNSRESLLPRPFRSRRRASTNHIDSPAGEKIEARHQSFLAFLDGELCKIEDFYKIKEAEATEHFHALREQLGILRDRKCEPTEKHGSNISIRSQSSIIQKASKLRSIKGSNPSTLARRKLKEALQEYYRGLELLKSYCKLNHTAFRKIVKKFNKVMGEPPSARMNYVHLKVDPAHFAQSRLIDEYQRSIEDLYTRSFERGIRKTAVTKLRAKAAKFRETTSFGPILRSSLFCTAGLLLGIEGVYFSNQTIAHSDSWFSLRTKYLQQIYGGYCLMALITLLFCFNCRIWTKSRINHVFIFELNTSDYLDWKQLTELPSLAIFLLGLVSWLNFGRYSVESFYLFYPVVLVFVTVGIVFFPAPILYHRMRKWFLYSHWRLLFSGFYPVEWRDVFFGDMYCSLSYSVGNLEMFSCIYAYDWSHPVQCESGHSPLLGFFTAVPGIWRTLQCLRRYYDTRHAFPHLANCVKYIFTILFQVSLSMFRIDQSDEKRIFFIVAGAINSFYTITWDIIMDWSLGSLSASKPLLRKQLGFKQTWFYYLAMLADPILRFTWILFAIFPHHSEASATLSFLLALAEVLRRTMWALLRVENEHCTNVNRARALRDLKLPYTPLSKAGFALEVDPTEKTVAGETTASSNAEKPSAKPEGRRRVQLPPIKTDAIKTRRRTLDVERQSHYLSPGGTLKQLRLSLVSSPLATHLGHILHSAHAEDFQRRGEFDRGAQFNIAEAFEEEREGEGELRSAHL